MDGDGSCNTHPGRGSQRTRDRWSLTIRRGWMGCSGRCSEAAVRLGALRRFGGAMTGRW